jgi:tetratricopeptide (TPR) repeat protein
VRAKAAELTKGLTDDDAKLRAIYSFVSTQYRYIGIAFGVGRYQPHAADDVLSNSYGDCKDKHTLLASLLQASGVTINPALINSSYTLDEDVPSPAQFDHIIGYLPGDKGAEWLDTTPEVTPLGFLLPGLRDKKALVISGDSTARLVSTPADPPFPASQNFSIEGKLQDDGTLEAKVQDSLRGENEVYLRAAFRQVPQSQWKDLVQQISYQLGYSGTVSDVSASTPEAVNEPFHFAYSYHRKDYPEWSNHRFTVPGLPFAMPPVHDETKYPIWLGSALQTISKSKVELPKGYAPQIPANVDLKYDFAEYQATYSQEAGTLLATRRLVIKQHEVPVAELADYRKFLNDMFDDVNQYVSTTAMSEDVGPGKLPLILGAGSGSGKSPVIPSLAPPDARIAAFQNRLRSLPDSASPEASKLEADAREQMIKHDLSGAVSSLYRAVAADTKFARGWVLLGSLLFMQKQIEAGTDAFHKAMSAAPDEPAIPKSLAFALMANADYDAAVPVWQDFIKAHPDDADGPANLGNCFRKLNRNSEAAAAYEAALKIKSDLLQVQMSLGSTYLQSGDRQKASLAFQKVAEMDSKKIYLNDVAYVMANNDLDLSIALAFAKQAVRLAEDDSEKVTLADLKVDDLERILQLAAYWDTLGWVHERMSSMERAEEYLKASWKLDQDGVVAGHLCHMYRREHRTAAAIQMCRMAISRMSMSKQISADQFSTELAAANENLNNLTGRPVHSTHSFDSSDITIAQRTFKLPRFLPGTESAEFFLLFASDGKSNKFRLEDMKFISGSDKMKNQAKQLKSIDFNVPVPGDARARFVWRGILGCYQYTGCSFVVLDPISVHSLN